MIIDTARPVGVEWKNKTALDRDGRGRQETFGAEEIRREAITVMCPLSSLRTAPPLDFRKLQLDSSKAIKLSTDKNKRMFFHSPLFLCLFIPLSPFCSSLCPLPYPPLGLRALPNLSLSAIVLCLSHYQVISLALPFSLYPCISMFGCVSPFTGLLSL